MKAYVIEWLYDSSCFMLDKNIVYKSKEKAEKELKLMDDKYPKQNRRITEVTLK
jgi:hypothetical protein